MSCAFLYEKVFKNYMSVISSFIWKLIFFWILLVNSIIYYWYLVLIGLDFWRLVFWVSGWGVMSFIDYFSFYICFISYYFHFIFPVIRFYIKNNFPFILNFRKLFIFINLNKLFWCKNTSILKYWVQNERHFFVIKWKWKST